MSQSTAVDLVRQKHFGHYEIVEKLGRGGMGVVYRARDLTLRRWVAIKVLRGQTSMHPDHPVRFQQEARAASALNHPNIVTVHEIGDVDGIRYIAMELVEGRTLRDILLSGALLTRRALQLAAQAAHGLAQAHAAGIVHRDLKPENIMVTPDGRVKILDFGLAKIMDASDEEDGATGPLETPGTEPGVILGTVGYMSPEQALGQPLDFRSDQFSCGAILYEMATGVPAFRRASRAQTLSAIIEAEPEPIVRLNPAVPAPLRWIVDRCLAKDPAERYGSTRDLARDLESVLVHLSEVSPAADPSPRDRRQRSRRKASRLLVVATVVAALASALGVAAWVARSRSQTPPEAPARAAAGVPARRSVAVLGFKNLSGNIHADWLSPVLAEWLTTELAAGGRLRTIPGENVGRMKMELHLSDADSLARDTLTRVGRNLGTDMVLLGSYVSLPGDQLRLDLRLQDVAAGETVAAMAENGTETGLVELVTRAGSHLRQKIGVEEPPREELAGLAAGAPSTVEAQRLYGEGLARLRVLDGLAARDLLVKAVAADPNSPMAHLALADAWTMLGYDAKAKEEAQLAFDLSGNLTREDRLSVEGRYRALAGEWDKAIEIYGGLQAFFPDNVEYGLRLADAQSTAGKGQAALATIAQLRKVRPPESEDPRIDLGEAAVARSLGDFKLQQVAANRAAAKGATRGARLLVAQARIREAYALNRLGEVARATAAAEEAREIYAEAGDRAALGGTLNMIGIVAWDRGDLEKARTNFDEALNIRRQVGHRSGVAASLHNLGGVHAEQGDLDGARRSLEEALATNQDLGNRRGMAVDSMDLAYVLEARADLTEAKKLAARGFALATEVGDKTGAADAETRLAEVLRDEGDLAGAEARCREALPVLRQTGTRLTYAYALYQLGEILRDRGDLVAARNSQEEARAVETALGAALAIAKSEVALARLSMDEGRSETAEPLLRAASATFAAQKAADAEASAQAALASALLTLGKRSDALKAIDRALVLSGRSQNPHVRLAVGTAAARVRAATGHSEEALDALATSWAEAVKLRLVGAQLAIRLAEGEIGLGIGRTDARDTLMALAREARAKGFGLVAGRAESLLKPPAASRDGA
jgi:tetratricopeptide (TPR) repeat protein/TolB-like protein